MRQYDMERLESMLARAKFLLTECERVMEEGEEADETVYDDAYGLSFTLSLWVGHLEADLDEARVELANDAEDAAAEEPDHDPPRTLPRWLRSGDQHRLN